MEFHGRIDECGEFSRAYEITIAETASNVGEIERECDSHGVLVSTSLIFLTICAVASESVCRSSLHANVYIWETKT